MTNTVQLVPTDKTVFDILIPKTIYITAKVRVKEGTVVMVDGVPMLEHADNIAGAFFMRVLHSMDEAIGKGWVEVLEQEEVTLSRTRKL